MFIKRVIVLLLVLFFCNRYLLTDANGIFPNQIISNLNVLLNIFGRQICFILLDNHLNIDMPFLDYPTVIRHLDKIDCDKNATDLLYRNKKNLPKKQYEHPKICARLDLFKLSSGTKPWNCQVQVQVYPEWRMFFQKSIIYQKIFYHKISINYHFWEFMEPSIVPHVNILILQNPNIKSVRSVKGSRNRELITFYHWIRNTVSNGKKSDRSAQYLATNVFVVAYTGRAADNFPLRLTKLLQVENCGHCKSSVLSNPGLKTFAIDFNSLSTNIFKVNKASQISNTFWSFMQSEYNDRDDRIINGITNHFRMCQNYLLRRKKTDQRGLKSLANIPFKSLQNRLFHALASLLQVSLTNYTYNCFETHICINGQTIKRQNLFNLNIASNLAVREIHSKFSAYQMLSLPEDITNLRFISCGGRRGKQPILFSELVNVYDIYIWICIVFSSLSLTYVLCRTYTQKVSFQKYFSDTLYLMVEQNSKLFDCKVAKNNIRFSVGSFLLASIVLSNAYRSENMYNITKLRKQIPYNRLQELLDNNFTIYSRSSYIFFDALSLHYSTRGTFPNLTTVNPHYLAYSPKHKHMLSVTSELYELVMAIKGYNETVDVVLSKLFNATRLHPKLESIITKTFYPFMKTTSRWSQSLIDAPRKTAWNLESKSLRNFLFQCTKTALVIPEDLAIQFGRELQLKNIPDVYIGKEIYSGTRLSLTFSGWIQPIVLRRLKIIKESGLWDWWPKFIRSSKQFIVEDSYIKKETEKPNMGGNIMLLFIMILYCLSGTVTVFVFEVRESILRGIQSMLSNFVQIVSLILSRAPFIQNILGLK